MEYRINVILKCENPAGGPALAIEQAAILESLEAAPKVAAALATLAENDMRRQYPATRSWTPEGR
jgi:hypothetical protein